MLKWKRQVNRRMKHYGDIDFEKKVIRVNPQKGYLVNTIIHEELHRQFPDKPERWIYRRARFEESQLSVGDQIKLLKQYL